ncbi:NAD-dependent deacylase [Paenibacillus sp.]|uniref:SIR2 family NAD-dependent protein deacylase n=1 Tax=Paenibacillus sp. TaxID=58172 RepID=UPI002D3A4178|nr:NAD-dependent deacylase [Paenibacillus sp.]HZG88050.1 NAD-dependent deacylase [Paenibacillus sp.]
MSENALERAAEWLRTSRRTVALTGAGMSTESGLPDFRSKDGWWRKLDPHAVANVDTLEDNYELFRDFYRYRIETLAKHAPHEGHRVLARWERAGLLQAIATQNVDGFHQAAGSERVAELHGSLRSARCHGCGRPAETAAFAGGAACASCGGRLRPNVVLFGETLPERAWREALGWFREAELVLVIGTSLQVAPASALPQYTDGRTVYLNMEIGGAAERFDLAIAGRAGELLQALDRMVTPG